MHPNYLVVTSLLEKWVSTAHSIYSFKHTQDREVPQKLSKRLSSLLKVNWAFPAGFSLKRIHWIYHRAVLSFACVKDPVHIGPFAKVFAAEKCEIRRIEKRVDFDFTLLVAADQSCAFYWIIYTSHWLLLQNKRITTPNYWLYKRT